MESSGVKWVRLGDYISRRTEKNNNYDVPIYGVTRDGFIPPKQKEADTSMYNTFYLNDFVFNPARMEINSIYLNDFCEKAICSSLYEIFYIKNTNILLPHYLHIFLKRDEFARQCEYIGWGSAREYCRTSDISDIKIPLPSVAEQQKVVNACREFLEIKEKNEAKAAPLMQLCQSYIQELKHKYPMQEIGPYIEEYDERNSNEAYGLDDVRGISIEKKIIDTKANMDGVKLSPYKVFRPNTFCYVTITSRNGEKITLSLNNDNRCYIVSSSYITFRINQEDQILPRFLYLWFCRPEFDRYARFNSWGSAREAFSFEDMKRCKVPLPPIAVQQAIVNIYKCANEAKQIAEEADRLSREACPALLQHVIHS